MPLVGLSALMTTTVVSMEQTIRLLRERKPDARIVVGGAVLTQEYADSIGADCYARVALCFTVAAMYGLPNGECANVATIRWPLGVASLDRKSVV